MRKSKKLIVKIRVANNDLGNSHSAIMYDETRKFHRLIEFHKIQKKMGGEKVRYFLIEVFAKKFKFLKVVENASW